jgi:hypothetical protein
MLVTASLLVPATLLLMAPAVGLGPLSSNGVATSVGLGAREPSGGGLACATAFFEATLEPGKPLSRRAAELSRRRCTRSSRFDAVEPAAQVADCRAGASSDPPPARPPQAGQAPRPLAVR